MGALSFQPKSIITLRGREFRVMKAVGVTTLMVQDAKTKAVEVVNVTDLAAPADEPAKPTKPIDSLHDTDLAEARRRLEIIRPLLALSRGTMEAVNQVAQETGIGASTLRRWVHRYEDRGLLSDLAPQRRGKHMPKLLNEKIEAVISHVIEEGYLTRQRLSVTKAYQQVVSRCKALRLLPPHQDTFRRRIKAIPERTKTERRYGRKIAHDRHGAVMGAFPGANHPLAVVQIDHTLLDIILVDELERRPIGRPWVTLAIDVYSRMVTGYYLSLDHPSAFSVGMCVAHAVGDKTAELQRMGVGGEWPVWGMMDVLHADNGKEFRSRTIMKACEEYGVRIEWRPVKMPHFGGHIERLMGTVATEIHALPGTTFSNVQERKDERPEKTALMTFREFEKWFATWVVKVYHQRKHKGIGVAPSEQWCRGIVGHGPHKGIGLPAPVGHIARLRLDFLPYEERVVARDGITWDKVTYFGDALRPWINARKAGRNVKFIVRRDPRDISKVFFLDPELKEYLTIPYRDLEKPSISLWEYKAARRYLEGLGRPAETDDQIFAGWEEMKGIVDGAKVATRKARRNRERKKHHAETMGADNPSPVTLVVNNDQGDFDIPVRPVTFEEL
jgi:putative transposase